MNIKVLRDFRDKENSLEFREKGTILNVTKERAEKLICLHLAEAVQEKSKETSKQAAE